VSEHDGNGGPFGPSIRLIGENMSELRHQASELGILIEHEHTEPEEDHPVQGVLLTAPRDWPAKAPAPRQRILTMHRIYGRSDDERCKTCVHFLRSEHCSTTYFKCGKNRITNGPGTDWRANWPACGLWTPRGEED